MEQTIGFFHHDPMLNHWMAFHLVRGIKAWNPTDDEIAEIMEVSKGFVSKLQAKYKVKLRAEIPADLYYSIQKNFGAEVIVIHCKT